MEPLPEQPHPYGGWGNGSTQQASSALLHDPVARLELLDRINSLAAGLTLAELTREAGREAAGVYYGEINAARDDSIDWQQIGEDLLLRVLSRGIEREL